LAWRARADGRFQRAEHFAREALEIFPAEPRAAAVLGDLLRATNRQAGSRAVWKKAARHPAANAGLRARAYAELGMLAQADGEPEASARYYTKAFDPEPLADLTGGERKEYPAFLAFRAEEIGRLDEAAALYRFMLEDD